MDTLEFVTKSLDEIHTVWDYSEFDADNIRQIVHDLIHVRCGWNNVESYQSPYDETEEQKEEAWLAQGGAGEYLVTAFEQALEDEVFLVPIKVIKDFTGSYKITKVVMNGWNKFSTKEIDMLRYICQNYKLV